MSEQTLSQSCETPAAASARPVPGLVLVFSGARAHLAAAETRGEPVVLGRDGVLGLTLDDARLSRRHAAVAFASGRFRIQDLESRNGTFIDGERVHGECEALEGVLRVGDTVLLLCRDVRPFLGGVIERVDGLVVGPTLRAVWQTIAAVAAGDECLHIRGETGTGKELAARHFHAATQRPKGPFSAINCATIPPLLAERLLFGARRGAYSGADADSDGFVQSAHGGTLFLDEVADLDLAVQAKLLRVLEERQVLPLGGTKPVAIDVRVCSATHRDLADEVARGRFREDLYYRLGLPEVTLPPLRARREDLPSLIHAIAARAPGALRCHASLIEAALTRPWPGNVRELEKRIAEAARAAHAAGDQSIRASHLPRPGARSIAPSRSPASMPLRPGAADAAIDAPLTREAIARALVDTGGNVTAAAVALGLHRTQLRRLMVRLAIRRTDDPGDR